MAAIPVRKPVPGITDRESAFDAITLLHKDFLEINETLRPDPSKPSQPPAWSDAEKQQIEQLLSGILQDLKGAHRELSKYPAPTLDLGFKQTPLPTLGKAKIEPAALQAAKIQEELFQKGHLEFANSFLKALQKAKGRFTPAEIASAQRQYEDLKKEAERLNTITTLRRSPMKYLSALAQSKMPKSNYIQVGSTKYYMNEGDPDKLKGIPLFKEYFFKADPSKDEAENRIKLELLKGIFTKVFSTPGGTPLPICDREDTGLLEEALTFYVNKLRDELLKMQQVQGVDAIPVRALLRKVIDVKEIIDNLLARQNDICSKQQKDPEPEPLVGMLGPDELKRILRKVILILAAKQKDVGGKYKQHMVLADKLLGLLSPASIPDVQNANIPGIEKNLGDILEGTKLMKMLYDLGKGSVDEVVQRIENAFALQLLQKMEKLIDNASYLTPTQKTDLKAGIDFTTMGTARDQIEILQKRLLDFYNSSTDQLNKIQAQVGALTKAQADLLAEQKKTANLQAEIVKLQGQLLAAKMLAGAKVGQTTSLDAQLKKLQGDHAALQAITSNIQAELIKKDAEIARLNAEIAQRDASIQTLTADLNACNADKATLNTTIADLQGQLTAKDQEKTQALAQKDAQMKAALQLKDVQIDSLNRNIDRLRQTIQQLQTQLQNFAGLPPDFRQQYADLKAQKAALEQREQKLQADLNACLASQVNVQALTDQINTLTDERDKCRADLAGLTASKDAEIARLTKQRDDAAAALSKLQADTNLQISNLQAAEAALKQQLADLERTKNSEIARLTANETALKEQLATLQQEKSAKDAAIATLTASEATLKKQLADLETAKNAEIAKLTSSEATLKKQLADLISKSDNEIRDLNERISKLDAEKRALEKQIAGFQGDRDAQIKDLTEKIATLTASEGNLKRLLAALKLQTNTKIGTLTQQVADKDELIKKLNQELTTVKEEKAKLEADQQALEQQIKAKVPGATSILDAINKLLSLVILLQGKLKTCEDEKKKITETQEKTQEYLKKLAAAAQGVKTAQKPEELDSVFPGPEPDGQPIRNILERVKALLTKPAPTPTPPPGPKPDYTYDNVNFYCKDFTPLGPQSVSQLQIYLNQHKIMPEPTFTSEDRKIAAANLKVICKIPDVQKNIHDYTYKGINFNCEDFKLLGPQSTSDLMVYLDRQKIMPKPTYQAPERELVATALKRICEIPEPSQKPLVRANTHTIDRPRQTMLYPAGRPGLGRSTSMLGGTRKLKKKTGRKTRKNKHTAK
jgi:DNA repair exonuclease SbcCD ATPase subunit